MRSRSSCATSLIATRLSCFFPPAFIAGFGEGELRLGRFSNLQSQAFGVWGGGRNTRRNDRDSAEAPNVPRPFPSHYRRICGNGILIGTLLGFHWMRWLVLRRARCELGTIAVFYKQIRGRERVPTDARVKLVIQSDSPRRALIIVRRLKQWLLATSIRDISVDGRAKRKNGIKINADI